jgi:hypothetical protein
VAAVTTWFALQGPLLTSAQSAAAPAAITLARDADIEPVLKRMDTLASLDTLESAEAIYAR